MVYASLVREQPVRRVCCLDEEDLQNGQRSLVFSMLIVIETSHRMRNPFYGYGSINSFALHRSGIAAGDFVLLSQR